MEQNPAYYNANPNQWAADNNNATKESGDQYQQENPQFFFPGGNPPAAPTPAAANPAAPVAPPSSTSADDWKAYLATNANGQNAWDALGQLLDLYGLGGAGGLTDFVQKAIENGQTSDQITVAMRGQPAYLTRFAGNAERVKSGLTPLSESDYINTEKAYATAAKSVGLPVGFYDQPSDFVDLIGKDISSTEYQSRLVNGYQAAMMSDSPTKAALQSMYGLTDGDLAAYWLDPDKTEALLTKQFTAAQLNASAARSGYGSIGTSQAEGLAAQGVTSTQAATGFGKLASESQLMGALPGSGESGIDTQTQLNAAFGQNAAAQKQISDVAAGRVATFGGGGAFSTDKQGTAGIGAAQ